MGHFFDEYVLPMLCGAGLMVLVFTVLISMFTVLEVYQCAKYETVTSKPTRYEGLACYVQDKGEWYSWTEYKHRLATKGEFSK